MTPKEEALTRQNAWLKDEVDELRQELDILKRVLDNVTKSMGDCTVTIYEDGEVEFAEIPEVKH